MASTIPSAASLSSFSIPRWLRPRSRLRLSTLLLLGACYLASTASAAYEHPRDAAPTFSDDTLAVDHSRPVMVNGEWLWIHEDHYDSYLQKRQEEGDEENERPNTTSAPSATGTRSSEDESETASSRSSSSRTRESPSPLPSPFDNNLDYNFTTNGGKSCPKYLNNLLMSETFKSCYPISMLLQASKSFFDALKELQSIVRVLDATCAADLDFCTDYLRDEADAMVSADHCSEEYARGQPNILQAHLGLTSYAVLYKATCLRDRDSDDDMYCFANAVTNTSTPANAYVYFLPLNMTFPQNANPGCGACLQDTMAIYQAASASRSQAIASTYEEAARQVNAICGPLFVNDTLPPAVEDAAGRVVAGSVAVLVAGVVVLLNWL